MTTQILPVSRHLNISTLFFIALLCAVFSVSGQGNKGFPIQGTVLDGVGHAVEGASVALLNKEQKVVAQTLTDAGGKFSLNSTVKDVQLVVGFVGFDSYRSKPISLNTAINLEPVVLINNHQKLNEVVIKGQNRPPLIQATGGKIVFNVAASVNAQGSNVLEVLKKAPGVLVSSDNVISIAGRSGALVMLNGKQTYMQAAELADLLKSTPASNVKSIEVIGNPSAQYDAAGSGGIINIVLKKNENEGFNGTVTTGASYGISARQNTELSFNYRKDKFNIYGNYNNTFGHFGYRYGFDRDQAGLSYRSWSKDTDKRNTIGSSIGADYQINATQTIGVLFNGNFLYGGGYIRTLTDIRNLQTGMLQSTLLSESDYYHQQANRYNSSLNYQYEDTLGRKLHLEMDYGIFKREAANYQPNTYFNPDGSIASTATSRTLGNIDIDLYAFSAGYETKLWEGKLNFGLKYSSIIAGNLFDYYDVTTAAEIRNEATSNSFDFKERIASSYVQYDRPLTATLSFQAGLRLEQTNATGTLISVASKGAVDSEVKRNYLNAFPSLGIMMKIRENQSLSINYGSRIDRPAYQNLNPIEQPLDGLSVVRGNPYLLPQTTQRLSAQYAVKKTIVELSYAHTDNLKAEITDTLDVNKVVMEPRNLGTRQQASLSVIQQFRPLKIWEISANATTYYVRNNISFDNERHFDLRRLAASFNVQQTFSLPFKVKAEVGAVFNTKRLGSANDVQRWNSQVDLGFQRSLLKDKAKLSLAFTDLFLGNIWDGTSVYTGYSIRSYGHAESRQVKLNFSYNFGNLKVKAPKEKASGLKAETERL